MKDQVTGLNANGIPAAAINSVNNDADNRTAIEEAMRGHVKLLYMSPERLMIELDRSNLISCVSFFAIDEAHCISQWGHDFRPEYAALNKIKQLYPDKPVIALTATADRITRDDIVERLQLKDPFTYIASFDRPNLSLKVMANPGKAKRLSIISSLIDRYPDDSGIIYCISRKGAETMSAELELKGYRSIVYHAGLSPAERDRAQEQFINGEVQVVCATVAFGMGIDKSNIRWVVHNNMPRNMESYYQEIGRAGRDGMKAETLLFYSFADVATLTSFIADSGQPVLNTEKLNRMKEYCESCVCRRRVLLSYFNETLTHDCGNCDVCLNPPERFDGTKYAQMALSAIYRTEQKCGITMLIDVLRGSARAELIERGFHKIKTYGVGRSLSFSEWSSYISQFIQLGLIMIAYNEQNRLKITNYGMSVLRGESEIQLSRFVPVMSERKGGKKAVATKRKANPAEQLFSELKRLRMSLAQKDGIPPYLVFTDKTLLEMVKHRPTTLREFNMIDGVGERKSLKYWVAFTSLIKEFNKNYATSH
jgi:ATP-dependent DNA helicase RecQ